MNVSLKLSQLNSIIGDITDWIGKFFTNSLVNIYNLITIVLYQFLIAPCFMILDFLQGLFKKFCGIETVYVKGEGASGDIVLTLLNNQTVQNVFWALLILAVILLIIVTIIAMIRKETLAMGDKNKKTNKQIFADVFRALLNFFMVPVVAVLGIFMGNAILKSLDSATNGGESVKISGIIFKATAYNSNRARKSTKFSTDLVAGINNMGVLKGNTDSIADVVDEAFAKGTTFESQSFNYDSIDWSITGDYYYIQAMNMVSYGTVNIARSQFSVYDASQVFYYYDLGSFNFLLAIIAILFTLWILLTTCIGLTKRIFKLVILFCISPPIIAISPLDGGKALGNWKKNFIGSVLSAYATVVALNLVFLLFGPIQQISFFDSSTGLGNMGAILLDYWIQLLIMCGGLAFFKDFTKELAKMLDIENAYDDGSGHVKSALTKAGMAATVGVGLAGGLKNTISHNRQLNKVGGEQGMAQDQMNADNAVKQEQSKLEALQKSGADANKIKIQENRLKEAQAKQSEITNRNAQINSYGVIAKQRFSQMSKASKDLAFNGTLSNFTGAIAKKPEEVGKLKEAKSLRKSATKDLKLAKKQTLNSRTDMVVNNLDSEPEQTTFKINKSEDKVKQVQSGIKYNPTSTSDMNFNIPSDAKLSSNYVDSTTDKKSVFVTKSQGKQANKVVNKIAKQQNMEQKIQNATDELNEQDAQSKNVVFRTSKEQQKAINEIVKRNEKELKENQKRLKETQNKLEKLEKLDKKKQAKEEAEKAKEARKKAEEESKNNKK